MLKLPETNFVSMGEGGRELLNIFLPTTLFHKYFLFMAAFCFVAIKTYTATSKAEHIILDNLNLCSQDIVAHICLKLLFKQGFLPLNNFLIQTGLFTFEQIS